MAPAARRTLALALCVTLGQALRLGPQIFSRRAALAQGAALAVTPLAIPLRPALADVYGANSELPTDLKGINKFLKTQGFPAMPNANGLSPLMKYVGTAAAANLDGLKSKERAFSETLLVRWNFPSGWLITSPDITENGEAGTLGANNFIKGDSEVFAAAKMEGGKPLKEQNKEFFIKLLSSQMTSDVYEDIKPKKIKPVTTDDGTEMVLFDFTYTLLTRAGFTVERRGVASALQLNSDTAVALVCATTALRYKELEPLLRQSVDSFRAYPVKAVALPSGI